MNRLLESAGWLALIVYKTLGGIYHFRLEIMRPVVLALFLILTPFIWFLWRRERSSDLDLTLIVYFFLATLGFWLFPDGLGRVMVVYPITVLYILLFLTAAAPLFYGGTPFTTFYARKKKPREVWETPLFKDINRYLTGVWAVLFALSALVSLVPHLAPALGRPWLFNFVLPAALLLGVGLGASRWYPVYRRRQMGL